MPLLLGQLVYTSFTGVGLRTLASTQVPKEIQQAFIQQVVYKHWNSYNPPRFGYRAAYLHQVTLEHTLFGWLYNEGQDDLGRRNIPYFVCYYLAEVLHVVQLENIFTCLHKGPVALIDRQSLPAALETIVVPDLWSYQPACIGVAIPLGIRESSQVALKQRSLLNLFVSVDEREMVTQPNEQIEQQSAPVETSVTATPVPDTKLRTDVQTRIGQGDKGDGRGDNLKEDSPHPPSSPNKSAFLIGIAIGIASALPLIALPLMVWSYYLLQPAAPGSKVQQYPVSTPIKKVPLQKLAMPW